jgi:hypothetical protein
MEWLAVQFVVVKSSLYLTKKNKKKKKKKKKLAKWPCTSCIPKNKTTKNHGTQF